MSYLRILLKLGLGLFTFFINKSKEKKEERVKGYKQTQEGRKKKDISEITAGIDRINRNR